MSDFAPIGIDEYGQVKIGGGDARLWVQFSRRARKHAFKSEQEGRPVYEQVDYIQIQQSGERDQLVRPVREEDKLRFPKQWAEYQSNVAQVPEGTPVKDLFPNSPEIVSVLKDLKILTVEQLAGLGEHGIQRLGMDGRKYVQRALAYLNKAENMKEVNRLSLENRDLTDRIKILEGALKEIKEERAEERARPKAAKNTPKVFDTLPPPPPPEPPQIDPYVE